MSSLLRVIFDPDTIAPSAPAIGSATALNETTIRTTWSASTDTGGSTLAGYRVYRATSVAGTYGLIAQVSVASLSYDDATLAASQQRFYKVTAYDGAGNESALSSAVSATTPDQTSPGVPTNFIATAVSSSAINLSWSASSDNVAVTGYRVERSLDGLTGWSEISQPTTTSYSDTGRSASTQYFYRVRAQDAVPNFSAYSAVANATTQGAGASPQQEWITRSTAAGVTAAYEMTPAQITAGYTSGDGGAQGFADSVVNGGWGTALRLHSPVTTGGAGQLPAGQWHGVLNGSYGQNTRLCISWLARLSASMFSNLANNGGSWNSNWKTITVYPGGPPCQTFEFTMVHPDPFTPGGGPASAYKNCGDNFTTVLTSSSGTSNTNPAGAYWQQDFIPPGSTREANGYRAAVGSSSGMFQYPADRWFEVYVELVWSTFSSSNNTISVWCDDLQGPVRGRRRFHGWSGQMPGTNGSGDRMTDVLLMNYMTSNTGKTNQAADSWYKAFIASTNPIPAWQASAASFG